VTAVAGELAGAVTAVFGELSTLVIVQPARRRQIILASLAALGDRLLFFSGGVHAVKRDTFIALALAGDPAALARASFGPPPRAG
jgi:hypothetical protein